MPRWAIIIIDQFLSFAALIFAYLIRFDLKADRALIEKEWMILSKTIWVYFAVKILVFYFFKIHKGLIRHTSFEDIRRIFLAVLTSSIIFVILGLTRAYFLDQFFLFPTTVLIMEMIFSFVFLIGARFTIKLLYLESIKSTGTEERILIYGAGISGLITKRTIEKDVRLSYKIIGFIDDNKKMSGTRLEGVRIFHTSKLEALIKDEGVTSVILAIQKPDEDNRKRIVEICLGSQRSILKIFSEGNRSFLMRTKYRTS